MAPRAWLARAALLCALLAPFLPPSTSALAAEPDDLVQIRRNVRLLFLDIAMGRTERIPELVVPELAAWPIWRDDLARLKESQADGLVVGDLVLGVEMTGTRRAQVTVGFVASSDSAIDRERVCTIGERRVGWTWAIAEEDCVQSVRRFVEEIAGGPTAARPFSPGPG